MAITESTEQDFGRRFGGVERLYGKQALINFSQAHIIVIGIGGVGSWVVEALARNAIGKITLIDMDVVAESNINRQLPALSSTIGENKIDVMARRVKDINCACEIITIDEFISKDNIPDMISKDADYVIDCIDNSRIKAATIAWCKSNKVKIMTIGGAGGQVDPTLIKASDLIRAIHDPLLSRTRKLLRREYNFSRSTNRRFNIPSVYSTEQMKPPTETEKSSGLSCSGGIGSSVMVTASFGFVAVSYVLQRLAQ